MRPKVLPIWVFSPKFFCSQEWFLREESVITCCVFPISPSFPHSPFLGFPLSYFPRFADFSAPGILSELIPHVIGFRTPDASRRGCLLARSSCFPEFLDCWACSFLVSCSVEASIPGFVDSVINAFLVGNPRFLGTPIRLFLHPPNLLFPDSPFVDCSILPSPSCSLRGIPAYSIGGLVYSLSMGFLIPGDLQLPFTQAPLPPFPNFSIRRFPKLPPPRFLDSSICPFPRVPVILDSSTPRVFEPPFSGFFEFRDSAICGVGESVPEMGMQRREPYYFSLWPGHLSITTYCLLWTTRDADMSFGRGIATTILFSPKRVPKMKSKTVVCRV